MADSKFSALTQLTGAGTATNDDIPIVDTSATLSKRISIAELLNAISALLPITTFAKTILDDADAATVQATLGLVPGTNVQALDSDLTAIAALAPADDAIIQRKASAWTSRTLAQLLTDLNLGAIYQATDSDLTAIAALTTTTFGRSFLTLADAAAARTLLALVIGTDVQAADSDLTAIAAIAPANDDIIQRKAGVWVNRTMAQLSADMSLSGFQPLDSDLTAIAALTTTSYGRAFLALADSTAARTALALVPGTDVQAYDAELQALAGLTSAADKAPYFTGTGTASTMTVTSFIRGLLDDVDAAAARTTLAAAGTADLAGYLPLLAGGASVENIGAVESNVETATVSSTKTLDTSVYNEFDYTMSANTTFTFSNPAPSGKCTVFSLILRGAFTPTFPGSVDWGDATPPTYTTPSEFSFKTINGGTDYLGARVGKAFG